MYVPVIQAAAILGSEELVEEHRNVRILSLVTKDDGVEWIYVRGLFLHFNVTSYTSNALLASVLSS